MAQMVEIKGLARVKARMASHTQAMQHALTVGLKRAGLLLQRESQKIVPVDTGSLKNSSFTRSRGDDTVAVEVQVGYTAGYALYVHENLDARHKAGKQAKFLEQPLRELHKEFVSLVTQELKRVE